MLVCTDEDVVQVQELNDMFLERSVRGVFIGTHASRPHLVSVRSRSPDNGFRALVFEDWVPLFYSGRYRLSLDDVSMLTSHDCRQHGRNCPFSYVVYYAPQRAREYLEPNRNIGTLIQGQSSRNWYGNMLVVKLCWSGGDWLAVNATESDVAIVLSCVKYVINRHTA